MKKNLLLFVLSVLLFCGCRSDIYYQNRAVERARTYLLEEMSGELNVDEMNFVRYNTPVLLHAPLLGSSGYSDTKEKLISGVHQVCVTWMIPGREDLFMVFGVSRARMDDWYPNRVLIRSYNRHTPIIASAVGSARNYAKNCFFASMSDADVNFVRFTFPWLVRTDFGLNFNPDGSLSAEELAEIRSAANEKIQYSLVWKFNGRNLVFVGLAERGFLDWSINFAGFISDAELAEHTVAEVLTPDEGLKNLPDSELALPEVEAEDAETAAAEAADEAAAEVTAEAAAEPVAESLSEVE